MLTSKDPRGLDQGEPREYQERGSEKKGPDCVAFYRLVA